MNICYIKKMHRESVVKEGNSRVRNEAFEIINMPFQDLDRDISSNKAKGITIMTEKTKSMMNEKLHGRKC